MRKRLDHDPAVERATALQQINRIAAFRLNVIGRFRTLKAEDQLPMLQRLFGLTERGTSVRTEILAGFTTFITISNRSTYPILRRVKRLHTIFIGSHYNTRCIFKIML